MQTSTCKGITRRQLVAAGAAASAALLAAPVVPRSSLAEQPKASSVEQTYTPGTYTGSAMGRKGPIGVEVTFSDHAIESIEITESHETPRIANGAYQTIPQLVIEYQSLGIDSVTGATLSSMGLINAIGDCVEQAGGNVSDLEKAAGPEKASDAVELNADIVVIGAGAAGMPCAIEGALRGAKVVVFEKSSNVGGNALVSGGVLVYVNAPDDLRQDMTDGYRAYFEQTLQNALAIGAPQELVDSIQKEFDDYYAAGNTKVFNSYTWQAIYNMIAADETEYTDDLYQVYLSTAQSGDLLMDWLAQTDIQYRSLVPAGGYPWPDNTSPQTGECGEGYFAAMDDFIAEKGLDITFLMATPVSELITEDGKVTGAKGTSSDGTSYTVHASKGVAIATGGFSGNPDMIVEHDDGWGFAGFNSIPTDNAYGHTGDGLKLAQSVGGAYADSGANFMILIANGTDISVESQVGAGKSTLMVNKEGKRFCDESGTRNGKVRAVMEQTDDFDYSISDAPIAAFEDGKNQFGIEEDMLLLMNKLYKADTVEELAQQIDIDPDTLAETVATFNEYVRQGSDPDFGRTLLDELYVIEEPPYYACPGTWAMHITNSGVQVDMETYAVLDESGKAVEGLYAIGEVKVGDSGITVMADGIKLARQLA